MPRSIKVCFEGKEYMWNGSDWYGSNFITVPQSKIKNLVGLIKEEDRLALLKEIEETKRQDVIAAHKEFLSVRKLPYIGTRVASECHHRVTHCYSCKKSLDNKIDVECSNCGWIVCSCGACGCGYGY